MYEARETVWGGILILKSGMIDIELTAGVNYLCEANEICDELNEAERLKCKK